MIHIKTSLLNYVFLVLPPQLLNPVTNKNDNFRRGISVSQLTVSFLEYRVIKQSVDTSSAIKFYCLYVNKFRYVSLIN